MVGVVLVQEKELFMTQLQRHLSELNPILIKIWMCQIFTIWLESDFLENFFRGVSCNGFDYFDFFYF